MPTIRRTPPSLPKILPRLVFGLALCLLFACSREEAPHRAELQDHYNSRAADLTIAVENGEVVVGPFFKFDSSLSFVARDELVQRGILRHRRYIVEGGKNDEIKEMMAKDYQVLLRHIHANQTDDLRFGRMMPDGPYFIEWWLVREEDRFMAEYVAKRFGALAELVPDPDWSRAP